MFWEWFACVFWLIFLKLIFFFMSSININCQQFSTLNDLNIEVHSHFMWSPHIYVFFLKMSHVLELERYLQFFGIKMTSKYWITRTTNVRWQTAKRERKHTQHNTLIQYVTWLSCMSRRSDKTAVSLVWVTGWTYFVRKYIYVKFICLYLFMYLLFHIYTFLNYYLMKGENTLRIKN